MTTSFARRHRAAPDFAAMSALHEQVGGRASVMRWPNNQTAARARPAIDQMFRGYRQRAGLLDSWRGRQVKNADATMPSNV